MNIQIFGRAKCFDTKKAERYFKERRVKYQAVELLRYGLSKGEYESVKRAVGGWRAMCEPKNDAELFALLEHLAHENEIDSKILDNPQILKTPIVRNGKAATVGYAPDVWGEWQ